MLERTDTAVTISCDACRAVCLVKSGVALKSDPNNPTAPPVTLDGNVVIRVRHGQNDRRHRRNVDGAFSALVKFPDGQVITIREYPFLCDDCYETGGVGKLTEDWKPLRGVVCGTCDVGFLRFEDDPKKRCLACLRADGAMAHPDRQGTPSA